MNILAMTMVLVPSAPPVYRAMFTIPNNALQNVMACRVFRKLRLGVIGDATLVPPTSTSTLSWRRGGINTPDTIDGSAVELESKTRQKIWMKVDTLTA